jgi:putative addiction module component (TIGR02574 family)
MAPGTAEILSSALALPVRERASLAHELLASLDGATDADAAEAWVAEVERRALEVTAAEVAAEDWAAVKERLTNRWRGR